MVKKKEILFEVLDVCSLFCRLLVRCYVISFVFAGLVFLGGEENCAFVWGLGKPEIVTGMIKAVGIAGGFVSCLLWFLSGMMKNDAMLWKGLFLGIAFLLFLCFPLSGIVFTGIAVLRFLCLLVGMVCEDLGKMRERRERL